MSAVQKAAKASLYIFGFLVFLIIFGASYFYMNMDVLAKSYAEKAASEALGVSVTIGEINIRVNEVAATVKDVKIANPPGFQKPHAIIIQAIDVKGESFTEELLTFSKVSVQGTSVNLEVNSESGVNLGAIKKSAEARTQSSNSSTSEVSQEKEIKVIVKEMSLTTAQLKPSVTLLGGADLAVIKVPDIHIKGIGEAENGVVAEEAIAQIMAAVLEDFNEAANGAGFLEGLSLDALKEIGVSTAEVFKKNLKKSYDKEVDKFKKGFDDLKGLFE